MTEFASLRPKSYRYFTDNSNENKKTNGKKKVCYKKTLKFQDYKHCSETTQHENKINHLEKNKLDLDSLRENHKEFIKTIN